MRLPTQSFYSYNFLFGTIDSDGIPQWSPEAIEGNRHNVAVFKPQPVFEAEHVGAEKVNVRIARLSESRILEVMVLEVRERVTHPLLATRDLPFPNRLPVSLHRGAPRNIRKIRINHQLRTQRT